MSEITQDSISLLETQERLKKMEFRLNAFFVCSVVIFFFLIIFLFCSDVNLILKMIESGAEKGAIKSKIILLAYLAVDTFIIIIGGLFVYIFHERYKRKVMEDYVKKHGKNFWHIC